MAALELINHQELSGTATTMTYTSIPSTYKHLYFVASTRTDNGSGNINMGVRFYTGSSSEVSSGYSGRLFKIGGYLGSSTPTGAAQTSQAQWSLIYEQGAGSTANVFTSTEFLIANYNTSNYKQMLSYGTGTGDSTSNGQYNVNQGAHLNSETAAITGLKLMSIYGSFVQYSTLSIYGLNGA
jgi:hypothetical protein